MNMIFRWLFSENLGTTDLDVFWDSKYISYISTRCTTIQTISQWSSQTLQSPGSHLKFSKPVYHFRPSQFLRLGQKHQHFWNSPCKPLLYGAKILKFMFQDLLQFKIPRVQTEKEKKKKKVMKQEWLELRKETKEKVIVQKELRCPRENNRFKWKFYKGHWGKVEK